MWPPAYSLVTPQSGIGRCDALRGKLILPADAEYDAARSIWNTNIDRRPALIARCVGVADVINAVTFARSNNLVEAVQIRVRRVLGMFPREIEPLTAEGVSKTTPWSLPLRFSRRSESLGA